MFNFGNKEMILMELHEMSAKELSKLIADKKIGVEELTRCYLGRIYKYDGHDGLNSIVELNENIISEAKKLDDTKNRTGDMFGLPILVKDNIDVAGMHTTAGSLALEDNIVVKDAHIIENLRKNGALILGKTNMTEFANFTSYEMKNGYSSRGGQVKNAYIREKESGGSSTGSAVAMSAGFCAAAIGTDTNFSIVGCATENGVTGLKPAYGSLSTKGILPISHTLDMVGPITQDLSDGILTYSCMRDTKLPQINPMSPKNIKLAVNIYDKEEVSDAQLKRYENLYSKLSGDGVSLDEITNPGSDSIGDIMIYEFNHDVDEYLRDSKSKYKKLSEILKFYENNPKTMMKYGCDILKKAIENASGKLNEKEYLDALNERNKLREALISDISKYDAVILSGLSNIMNFVGFPSIAIRLCMAHDETPRSVILYGVDEKRLFEAGLLLENYCPPLGIPNLEK